MNKGSLTMYATTVLLQYVGRIMVERLKGINSGSLWQMNMGLRRFMVKTMLMTMFNSNA